MANYASLKAAIQEVIKTNGNNAITGALLQQSLLAMVNSLGANYQFAGVATPSTNPGTPDQNIFYIASTAGTYANFGGLSLENGEIAILKYNGAWSKDSTGAASLEKVNQLGQKVYHDFMNTFSVANYFYKATNGEYANSPGDYSTPLLPINGNIYYNCYLGGSTYPLFGIVFFDENRQFINQSYYGTTPGFQRGELDITDASVVPANARFFSCTIFSNHITKSPYAYSCVARVLQSVMDSERLKIGLIIDKEESHLNYESSPDATDVYITDFVFSARGAHYYDIVGISALATATGETATQSPSGRSAIKLDNTKLLVVRTGSWSVKIISRGSVNERDIILASCRNGLVVDGELRVQNTKSIRIVPVDVNNFDVFVQQQNNGAILRHRFTLQQYTRTLNYGNGNTKSVECGNIWYPSEIYYNDEPIIQGNLNFIYRLRDVGENFANENDHVGAGHGGEVMDFQLFYADGKQFNPSAFTEMRCEVFRVVCKSYAYAIDTTQPGYVQGSGTLKLTDSGDKIVTAIHTYDAAYYVNNRIVWDNRLAIKRDGVVFMEANGAMCQGRYPAFNRVTVCDENNNTNNYVITYGTPPTITPIGNSKNLYTNQYSKTDAIILTGNGLSVKQKMTQEGKENSVQTYFYYNSGPVRLKCYMLPVKGVWEYPNDYETFNNGDIIKVHCEREIEITM